MSFMESSYEGLRQYARREVQFIQSKLDLICCLDERVCELYEKYATVIDNIDFIIQDELNERQEDQDLPTEEKINCLLVELLLDTKVKNPHNIKPKKIAFAKVLDIWRKQEQN